MNEILRPSMVGELNPNWKGGSSEYYNHSLMKRRRIEKLKSVGHLCELCGKKAGVIHHIDGSKDNHDIENLSALCWKCHMSRHKGRKNGCKSRDGYGLTPNEIGAITGVSGPTVSKLLDMNRTIGNFEKFKKFRRGIIGSELDDNLKEKILSILTKKMDLGT
jgi:hypothetical protein